MKNNNYELKNKQMIWSLNALFAYPFTFTSQNRIMILGKSSYQEFMTAGIIYPNDKIISRFIKTFGQHCDMLIYKNAIRVLNNPELQKKCERSI